MNPHVVIDLAALEDEEALAALEDEEEDDEEEDGAEQLPAWHLLKADLPLAPKGQESPRLVNGILRRTHAQRVEVQNFRTMFATHCDGLGDSVIRDEVFYPRGVPVDLLVVGYKRRPNSHFRIRGGLPVRSVGMLSNREHNNVEYVGKPDNDNVLKFVKDALEGIAFHNDSQTVRDQCMMQWDTKGKCDGRIGIYMKPFLPTDHDQFQHMFD